MAEIHEKSRYNAIFVAVEEGYSDQVIDTARAAGAKGGTVLRGRRRNSESISQHFGISIQDEQDLLMIIVPRDIKTEVMTAITSFLRAEISRSRNRCLSSDRRGRRFGRVKLAGKEFLRNVFSEGVFGSIFILY